MINLCSNILDNSFGNICKAKKSPEIILYVQYICIMYWYQRSSSWMWNTCVLKISYEHFPEKEYVSIIFRGVFRYHALINQRSVKGRVRTNLVCEFQESNLKKSVLCQCQLFSFFRNCLSVTLVITLTLPWHLLL